MALEVNGLRNDLAEAIYGVPLDRIQQEIHSGGGGGGEIASYQRRDTRKQKTNVESVGSINTEVSVY